MSGDRCQVWGAIRLGDIGGDRVECSLLLMVWISDGCLCIGDDKE